VNDGYGAMVVSGTCTNANGVGYKIEHNVNISELSITLKNGSKIYFSGAVNREEIEKFRGMSLNLVYIDEAQSFKPFIKDLVDEVLAYAVLDVAGVICMIGTPGPVPAGYFYDAAHSKGWKNHYWTIFDNPYIVEKTGKSHEVLLAEERARRGITETDPSYLREALGRWVQDTDSLVYKYNAAINHYDNLPDEELTYIFGIDLGFNDADAIAILGYSKKDNKVYLVEEYIKSKQTITDLIVQINSLRLKYKPVKMKIDAGALGKKISEELRRRHNIPVESADKVRKIEYIELLNDDLRTGRLMIKKDSTAAHDYHLIQWDIVEKERRTISDTFHSDIADAVLYAWRECNHFFNRFKVDAGPTSEEEKIEKFWETEAKKLKKGGAAWWDNDSQSTSVWWEKS